MTRTSLRDEFPAIHQSVNGKPLAYLDNAATTQRPKAVLDAMEAFYREDNANVHRGVHTLSQRATDKFESARQTVARFVNAPSPDEVVFTKGCTEAINLVAASWGRQNLSEGDVVLLSTLEHHSNIVPWQVVAQERGAKIVPIPIFDDCSLDMDAYRRLLQEHPVKVVGVKHVCNATGTVNPIGEMARLAHGHGAVIVVDGAQGLAHQKVDVQSMDIDFYAMAAHKVYGPMGTGALYGKRALLEAMPPYQTGGGMIQVVTMEATTYAPLPDKFEPGTPNVGGVIGFGAALEWLATIGVENAARQEDELLTLATGALAEIEGLRVVGTAPGKASILSFVLDCAHPHDIGTILDSEGVAVRSGHHCCQPLMQRMGVPATTRASISLCNDDSDVEALVRGLRKVVSVFG